MTIKITRVSTISGEPASLEDQKKIEELKSEKGITPDDLEKIMKAMPRDLNAVGLVTIFVNMMMVYDFMPRGAQIVALFAKVLSDLKDSEPDLFKEGGSARRLQRMIDEMKLKVN